MEEFDKIVLQATKVLNNPPSAYRTSYEHQNGLQAQVEKLEESQRKLEHFNGGRSGEVRSNVTSTREKILEKLQSMTNVTAAGRRKSPQSTSPSAGAVSGGAPTLPGSEEWLRQLQAEDEVDQEHERRHAKHRSGKNRGSHHRPSGSKKIAHGGGAAAGEIGTQRDAKNAQKEKLGSELQSRLVHLVHPQSSENLYQNEAEEARRLQQQQKEEERKKNQHHETHRECHFNVITQKLLSAPSHVTNVENQPLVELAFEPQKRLPVPTASLLLASRDENPQSGNYYHDAKSIASQVGFIVGGGGGGRRSGQSSRRSTPSKNAGAAASRKSPAKKKKSPAASPASLTINTTNTNSIHLGDDESSSYVDCETKVQMYRSVFDVVWALQAAANKGEIDLDDDKMMNAKSAELFASEIPTLIGGSGAADTERRLGGVAKVEDYQNDNADDSNNNNNKREPSSQTPRFGSRAATQEFLSPNTNTTNNHHAPTSPTPDDTSFPALGTANSLQQQQQQQQQYAGWGENAGSSSDDKKYTSKNNLDDDDEEEDDDDYDENDDSNNSDDEEDDNDDEYDVHQIAAKLAKENRERDGTAAGDNNNTTHNLITTDDEDLFSKAKGIMTQTNELTAPPGTLSLLPRITAAPWTVILVQGGYCAAAVFVQGIPIIHKAFHRYVVRKKQGGKQSNQEGSFGSAGSQIRKAQEKKFNEDVQVLLDAWRNLIDASWFIFYSAPSPSNKKLLVAHSDKVVNAAAAEKTMMHEAAQQAEEKIITVTKSSPTTTNPNSNHQQQNSSPLPVFKKSDLNASPISYDDPRVKSVPLTTKRPVFAEVVRVYETLSRCTVRLYYNENKNSDGEDDDRKQ